MNISWMDEWIGLRNGWGGLHGFISHMRLITGREKT